MAHGQNYYRVWLLIRYLVNQKMVYEYNQKFSKIQTHPQTRAGYKMTASSTTVSTSSGIVAGCRFLENLVAFDAFVELVSSLPLPRDG